MTEASLFVHKPVMPAQVLEALSPKENGLYLDGTLGLGGHAASILQAAAGSQLCGLDRDGEALEIARANLERFDGRMHYFHMEFADFATALKELEWNRIDGAFLDLGVSSLQLDKGERGFSFLSDERLDMRMDSEANGKDAWDIVNKASFDELKNWITLYGEEPQAGRIARNIVTARQQAPIDTTGQLADIIYKAYPPKWRRSARNHPATRTFQAIRMAVNNELSQLEKFLAEILPFIAPNGRIVIISFHSLEDRIVKNAMRNWAKGCICPTHIPRCVCGHEPEVKIIYKKPLTASEAEVRENPRARSAKLRTCEKII